jgi:hypothetical protein
MPFGFMIDSMLKKCKDHLESVEESYFQHLTHALSYGSRMVCGGLGAIVHAFIPALFQTTASRITAQLHEELQARLTFARNKRQHQTHDDSSKP